MRMHRNYPCTAWIAGLLVVFMGAAGCAAQSTSSRIRRLGEQESELRRSVELLDVRQQQLRREIAVAERQAAAARCHAEQEKYRAVVAGVFSEYSAAVAQHKGCQAKAAKKGGEVMALGCGLAALFSGGTALALCGGAFLVGSSKQGECDAGPPPMTTDDIRRVAHERTGYPDVPRCDGDATLAAEPRTRTLGVAGVTASPAMDSRDYFDPPTRGEARRIARETRRAERKAARAARRSR